MLVTGLNNVAVCNECAQVVLDMVEDERIVTPDAHLALREQWMEEPRAENGVEWGEKHAGLLALERDFLVECTFLD